jgi:hypothetical protein
MSVDWRANRKFVYYASVQLMYGGNWNSYVWELYKARADLL